MAELEIAHWDLMIVASGDLQVFLLLGWKKLMNLEGAIEQIKSKQEVHCACGAGTKETGLRWQLGSFMKIMRPEKVWRKPCVKGCIRLLKCFVKWTVNQQPNSFQYTECIEYLPGAKPLHWAHKQCRDDWEETHCMAYNSGGECLYPIRLWVQIK